jgi:hypothetical protein
MLAKLWQRGFEARQGKASTPSAPTRKAPPLRRGLGRLDGAWGPVADEVALPLVSRHSDARFWLFSHHYNMFRPQVFIGTPCTLESLYLLLEREHFR